MTHRYAILGGGRQGTAAGYDLARWGDAGSIFVGDADLAAATTAAARIDRLAGRELARPLAIDVRDPDSLRALLAEVDCLVSAVPWMLNFGVAEAAVAAGVHMCDLGGNTALVRRQLALDERAKRAGVSLIPDCGQVPGMGSSLMVYAMSLLDEPREVKMWDGGIPLAPEDPWRYALTFNIGGLTNEYDGHAVLLRRGRRVEVPCFDPAGYELVEFPPFGTLEAFVTAGGTSTLPWTFEGRIESLEHRTLRYPGHAAQWQAFRDAGLFGLEPIEVGSSKVIPRELLHALLEPRLRAADDFRDAVLVRIVARGRHRGRRAEARVDLVDRWDEETGFTAMQRTTGWDAAIVAAMMARGATPPGAAPRELSIDAGAYVAELRRRGFDLRETVADASS